jgi:hypothetical protein
MKKIIYLAGIAVISGIMFLSSCTTDDNTDLTPTINFLVEQGYIYQDATVPVNSTFKIKVIATQNASSGSNIDYITVTRIFNLNSDDTTFSVNKSTITLEITFTAQSTVGEEKIEFRAVANDGQSKKISLIITTEPVSGGEIDSFEMRVLGSYQSAIGSSFASINGNVYTQEQAFNNQALIDFLYWWGASTSATIGAPDDDNMVYTGTFGLPSWTTKNATRFKTTTLTSADFTAVADATPCIDNATGADQTRIGTLAIDQVIAFVTSTSKHGLIKVKTITTGPSGDIIIDVKVEK